MSQPPLLRLENVFVSYGQKPIVQDVSFGLLPGEILVIAGESGSGKSTVLRAIIGLLGAGGRITGGRVSFAGRDITQLAAAERRKLSGAGIAMIFQNAGASFCPLRPIGEQIYESVREHTDWGRDEFRRRAAAIMEHIHLPESVLADYPFQLSGGMAQRVGILAAMVLSPSLLLADEPTSALDRITQLSVVQELLALRERNGLAIVMVTHHLGVAWYMADHILIMRKGAAVEYGTKEQIFNCPQAAYTRELVSAVPRL